MAKYFYTSGKRKGKVYQEFYYTLNGQQIVNKKTNYCPVNTKWLSKEEFKNYVLSLVEGEFPQIYVLEELPEELFTYALVFVQNNQGTKVYLDKEEVRTEIRLSGDFDAVNVVDSLPANLQNNVIYFSKNKAAEDNAEQQNVNIQKQKSYIYVHEDNTTKRIIPQVSDLIPEECIKPGYILSEIRESKQYYGFNNFEDPNDIIFTDEEVIYGLVYVYKAKVKDGAITEIISKSTDQVYSYGAYITYEEIDYFRNLDLDQVYPILDKSIVYTQTIKTYIDNKTQPITDLTTKCLKDIYNQMLPADMNIVSDSNGYVFVENKPHLYLHHYHYDKGGVGEVNFMIYTTKSTQLNNTELGDFLMELGCDQYWRGYPAYGQGQRTGGIVSCIYAKQNSGGLLKYTIYVNSYTIGNAYQEDIGNYLDQTIFKIVQIF